MSMFPPRKPFVMFCFGLLAGLQSGQARPEAFEIGAADVDRLPGGREADGIIGDFVLRNGLVEVLVSGNLHDRKANMATLWDAPTPGCIYDFTFRGEGNDQLTLFAPGGQKGQISGVRVLRDGRDGEAVVRAEWTPAAAGGVGRIHDYILREGWRHVVVVSTYTNAQSAPAKISPAPVWKGLVSEATVGEICTGLCPDPHDRVGYAFAGVRWPAGDAGPGPAAPAAGGPVELAPGQSASFAAALAIGAGAADAFGVLHAVASGGAGAVYEGRLVGPGDAAVPGAAIRFPANLVGYADAAGRYRFTLPERGYQVTIGDAGRESVVVDLKPGAAQVITLPPVGGADIEVAGEDGRPLPCKVQFTGIEGTPDPRLGPVIRAHGCDNQYHSENGRFFQGLPAGCYRVTVTHGIEYNHESRDLTIERGSVAKVGVVLKRVVESPGWVSCDFHNHTTESGDNFCGTPDRIINLAAEQIEFAPATEHNRIAEWQSHIDRLGLGGQIRTVTGMELTGNGPHLNAFPLTGVPHRQDNGGPAWDPDTRISALRLRNLPGDRVRRWVQLNHPDMKYCFNDSDSDRRPDGGFAGLVRMIDGAEVYGEFILSSQRDYAWEYNGKTYRHDNWPLLWMQMLNDGQRLWTVATSDAHEVTLGGVGGWRTYVRSGSDMPGAIDPQEIVDNAKRGRMFVTTGPFLQVSTADGQGPGDTIAGRSRLSLQIRVQCNSWTDVDRVTVLINGRPGAGLDFRKAEHPEMFASGTLRFDRSIDLQLKSDAHIIVVAAGESSTLATGYGHSWQSRLHPVAYHNPLFVDVEGNGFEPNHDTLGLPYLVYGRTPGTSRPAR